MRVGRARAAALVRWWAGDSWSPALSSCSCSAGCGPSLSVGAAGVTTAPVDVDSQMSRLMCCLAQISRTDFVNSFFLLGNGCYGRN